MTQFTSIVIQFIVHYHPIHNPLWSNSLSIIIQFIAHYHPVHNPLWSNSLSIIIQLITIIQSLDTVPTASLNTPRNTKINANSLWHPATLQLHMKCLPPPVGTVRAGRRAVCRCVYRAGVRTWGVMTPRRWKWALWLAQRANWKANSLGFLWDFCRVLRVVELHPEHTVWFNELPVWKDLRFGGQTK